MRIVVWKVLEPYLRSLEKIHVFHRKQLASLVAQRHVKERLCQNRKTLDEKPPPMVEKACIAWRYSVTLWVVQTHNRDGTDSCCKVFSEQYKGGICYEMSPDLSLFHAMADIENNEAFAVKCAFSDPVYLASHLLSHFSQVLLQFFISPLGCAPWPATGTAEQDGSYGSTTTPPW